MATVLELPEWVPDDVRILRYNDRHGWEGARNTGLGASDASTVFDVNPYQDRYQLWAIKTGRMKSTPPNLTLRYGQINEQLVREAYEDDKEVTVWNEPNLMLQHPEDDWLRYSPDGLVMEFPRLFEAKTAKRSGEWRGEASDHAEAQVSAGMTVIGSPLVDADIHVMIGGDPENMLSYTIPYNQATVDAVREEMARFWHDHVLKDVPPQPTHRSLDALLGHYEETVPGSVLHVKGKQRQEVLDAVAEFERGRTMVSKGEKIRDSAKARLLRTAGEYEAVETVAGKELFTYGTQTRRRVTNGALMRAGLDPEEYREETTSRTLRVK